jgi:hypothetical protein
VVIILVSLVGGCINVTTKQKDGGMSPALIYKLSRSLDEPQFDYIKEVLRMAGIGKKFDFHGSFSSKSDAVRKEQEVGGFIRERKVRGKIRYFVLTEKK